MLGFDRGAARTTWTVILVLALVYGAYLLRKTLFVFVIALLFAYLLSPLVNFLDRLLPTRTRTPALALAYLLFVGVLVLAGSQIGSQVVEQANSLSRDLPRLLEKWQQPSPGASPTVNSMKEQLIGRISEQIREGGSHILSALPQAGLKALTIAGDLVYIVVIPILAFFFLKDAREIRADFLENIEDGRRRELLQDLMADVHLLLAHYMRALVILCAATFVAYSIFLSIVGVPYGILLAVVAALLEFIPMIGPLTAAVVILIVAGVSGAGILAVLIFLGAYRVFQDYVLSPHIMGQGVELHPLVVLFGVFAGAEIAGIAGSFLSVPVLALVRIVYRRFRKARVSSEIAPISTV